MLEAPLPSGLKCHLTGQCAFHAWPDHSLRKFVSALVEGR